MIIHLLSESGSHNLEDLSLWLNENRNQREDVFLTQEELGQFPRRFPSLCYLTYTHMWRRFPPQEVLPNHETFLTAILTRAPNLQHLVVSSWGLDPLGIQQLPQLLFGFSPPLRMSLTVELRHHYESSSKLLKDLVQLGYNQLRSFTCYVTPRSQNDLHEYVFLLNDFIRLQAEGLECLDLSAGAEGDNDFDFVFDQDHQLVLPVLEKLTELSILNWPSGAFRRFPPEQMPNLRVSSRGPMLNVTMVYESRSD